MDFSNITPLGRADTLLKEQIPEPDEQTSKEYEKAFKKYRRTLALHTTVRALLYASIITSVAANLGLDLDIITTISSYIGVSVLLILYAGLTYLSMIYREQFYVRRELMVSRS